MFLHDILDSSSASTIRNVYSSKLLRLQESKLSLTLFIYFSFNTIQCESTFTILKCTGDLGLASRIPKNKWL